MNDNIVKKTERIKEWCQSKNNCKYCPIKCDNVCYMYPSEIKSNSEISQDYNILCECVTEFGYMDCELNYAAMKKQEKEKCIKDYCKSRKNCKECALNEGKCLSQMYDDLNACVDKILKKDETFKKEIEEKFIIQALEDFCASNNCEYCLFQCEDKKCMTFEKEYIKIQFDALCTRNTAFRKKWTKND